MWPNFFMKKEIVCLKTVNKQNPIAGGNRVFV
jgi:hypothetical protein